MRDPLAFVVRDEAVGRTGPSKPALLVGVPEQVPLVPVEESDGAVIRRVVHQTEKPVCLSSRVWYLEQVAVDTLVELEI